MARRSRRGGQIRKNTQPAQIEGLGRGQSTTPPKGKNYTLQRDPYRGWRWLSTRQALEWEDPVLMGQSASKAGAQYRYPFGEYIEMVDKDAQVQATLTQRKMAVLTRERLIQPADDSKEAELAAALVRTVLSRFEVHGRDGGFEQDLSGLLDAIPYGISYGELVWEKDIFTVKTEAGETSRVWYVPIKMQSVHPRMMAFDKDLRLLMFDEYRMPHHVHPLKYVVFRPYTRFEEPFGVSAMRCLYFLVYIKKLVLQWWGMYNERYAMPAQVFEVDSAYSLTDDDITNLLNASNTRQPLTSLVMPPGVKLMLQAAADTGTGQSFEAILRYIDNQINLAIVGQNSTVDISLMGGAGNQGASEVQERVAWGIQKMDANALESIVNSSIIPPIIDQNLPGYPYPSMEISTDAPKNRLEIVQMYKELCAIDNYGPSAKALEDEIGVARASTDDDKLSLAPAPYNPNQAPSQQTPAKTKQKQGEREKAKPAPDEPRPKPS